MLHLKQKSAAIILQHGNRTKGSTLEERQVGEPGGQQREIGKLGCLGLSSR